MSEQQYETISCLYKLLDLNETGVWDSDGTFYLNRPFSTSTLSKLKYRSFSTNIKSSLQNVQTPTLNCSLCANVEILNTTSTAPENITTDELKDKPKLLTTGNINNDYSLNILNQTGLKSYNNLYGTNTIKISDFNIPLNNTIQESITSGLNLAKIELLKTLGLSINESEDQGNFDYMSFQYGDYRYKLNEMNTLPILNPIAYIIKINTANDLNILIKDLRHLIMYNYNQASHTLTKKAELNYNNYGTAAYFINAPYVLSINNWCVIDPEKQDSYYHLPDTIGHFDDSTYEFVKDFDLTKEVEYMTFVNKADFGLVLSCTAGSQSDNFRSNNHFVVCMAADDCVNKPSYMCASLQRILYNRDEFKMFGINEYEPQGAIDPALQIKDYTDNFYKMIEICQNAGCPSTAYFVKFDIANGVNGSAARLVFYFMDIGVNEKTFYVYAITGSNNLDNTLLVKDPVLKFKDIRTFTDNTNLLVSDPKIWNAFIDTYYGAEGALAINFGNINGLYAIGDSTAFWCPYDQYLGTNTDNSPTIYNGYSFIGNGGGGLRFHTLSRAIQNDNGDNQIIARHYGYPTIGVYNISSWNTIKYTDIQNVLNNYQQSINNPIAKACGFCFLVSSFSGSVSADCYFSIANDNTASYWFPGEVSTPSSGIRYTLANSMLSVNTWNGTFTAYLPQIDEYGTTTAYNWINQKHITPETAENYQYIYYNCNTDKASAYNEFINSIFKWDTTANTITFPVVPLYKTDTNTTYANLIFYITFTTSPNVIQFDPNIKQGIRSSCATYYSVYNQLINKNPSLYIQTYKFNDYFIILDEDYYNRINVYLGLITTDLTLNFISPEFPTINNCVFQLNESSLVDFKESKPIPSLARVSGRLIDAGGSVLLKEDAQKLYSNITICIDWEFAK